MKKRGFYIILFGLIMLLLTLPLIQRYTNVINVPGLKGYIKKVEKPEFSSANFLNDNFQSAAEKYEKRHIGFQPHLVRLNNQLELALYNEANAATIVQGLNGHFYAQQYIDSYYGTDYIGDSSILSKSIKIQKVQKALSERGIHLVFVIASSKPFIQPQFIPNDDRKEKGLTNYAKYLQQFDSLGINHIDFLPIILQMEDTSEYTIHPKVGIHWSYYAGYFVADSMNKYVESVKKVHQPELKVTHTDVTSRARYADRDIEDALNLFFTVSNEKYAYPQVKIDTSLYKPTLNALTVADSYYWIISHHGFSRLFSDYHFWFYYNEVFPSPEKINAKDLNLKEEVEQCDVIFIMATATKMKDMAWGFIDDCYQLYYPQ